MKTTTTLTTAQLKALALIVAADGGNIRGTIATSTRRSLKALGLIDSASHLTSAGLAAVEGK